MGVCRFFQQGYCRYGNNCRNEHIFNQKYSYTAPQPSNSTPSISTDQLLNLVTPEVVQTLKSGQWLLSCYAPFKGKPNFPGILDFSPEEIRFNTYQAQATGHLAEYVKTVQNAEEIYKRNYRAFLNPSNSLIRILQNLFDGKPSQSPFDATITEKYLNPSLPGSENTFGNVFQNTNTSNNNFNNAANIFSNANIENPNVFATATQYTTPQSVFQMQSPATNTSPSALFASANANLQSTSPTLQPVPSPVQPVPSPAQPVPTNVFAPSPNNVFAPAPNNNVFAPSPSNNVFASPFNQPPPSYQNPFEMPKTQDSSSFSSGFFNSKSADDPKELIGIVYSEVEWLSSDDIKAFEQDNFTEGLIPEIAPPLHMCN